MSEKQPIEQRIVAFLKEKKGEGTVDEVAAAVEIGRTSARKYLAGLTQDGTLAREPGGREGRRKLPDRFSVSAEKPAGKGSTKTASTKPKNGRLGPGELDKHVLAYMRKYKKEAPHTASAIGKGIERSSGAVANCLVRLEKRKEVRLARQKPRAYELKVEKQR
jgi:FaeA-like protein